MSLISESDSRFLSIAFVVMIICAIIGFITIVWKSIELIIWIVYHVRAV